MKVELIAISKIKPYKFNNKAHPEGQVQLIANSITAFGFLKPIIVDENDEILAGHGAFLGAIKAGMVKIPCVRHSNLSERQKRAYRIADNKIAEKSIWDFDKLAFEISELSQMDFDVELTGFDEQEIDEILKNNSFDVDIPKEPKEKIVVASHERKASSNSNKINPVSIVGDRWVMGGMELVVLDLDSSDDADWLVRRWQGKTGSNALHYEGLTFNQIEHARKEKG